MQRPLLFIYPGNTELGRSLLNTQQFDEGKFLMRNFPDGETYLRIETEVSGHKVLVLCNLHQPNPQFLGLLLLAQKLKDDCALELILVTPYLPYMRQDIAFQPGEAITSKYFAQLISTHFTGLITIDPHLHRYKTLSEIYSIHTSVLKAMPFVARWITENVKNPIIVGPDIESEQWVKNVANACGTPYLILNKERFGDRDVKITDNGLSEFKQHTPVMVDDIISTGKTMIAASKLVKEAGLKKPVCIGIHALFVGDAYSELLQSEIERVVTCNTIQHLSNAIDITDLITEAMIEWKGLPG